MATHSKPEDLLRAIELIPTDLDSAHRIAQEYEGDSLADTIHAVIHRREGDYSNSIYWWRRVGWAIAPTLRDVYPDGDPVAFVQTARKGPSDEIERVEVSELQALKLLVDD